ncbi:DUF3048 domain-containing protein [Oceanobacillus sp. Castelsardo]|uniref:DUF3048 domain-containing protein n=1 Tax=Oceanobacillus sp. Castelsardo TaxID=1851204 RepID=UPI000838FE6B|nr:DUF3048 domain-containing protein [Oceanobacillus sp. Castelsardo]
MRKLVIFFLVILVGLVGCSNDTEQNKEKENVAEDGNFKNIYPLTGLGTNEPVDNRVISVMVNNHPKARPQTGLSQADIVFELLAEGSITRFLALYHSNLPEVVGPVRSAREYYFELANGYNALYVYHGAADFVNDMIVNRGTDFLNGSIYDNDGYLFKRESFRKAPHNSYLQLGAVYDVAKDKGYNIKAEYQALPFLSVDEIESLTGEQAHHIEVIYSNSYSFANVQYDYNQDSGSYTRSSDGEKTVELHTEIPIEVENILIVETSHHVIDDAGRREIDLESGGNAYLLQKGFINKVNWENRNGRIVPVKGDEEIGFIPGQTWINVVPTKPGLEQAVKISNE